MTPSHRTSAACLTLQEVFPHASFAGCFCHGEIGPTPPDELEPAGGTAARMMGYSTGDCSNAHVLGRWYELAGSGDASWRAAQRLP